MRALGRMVIGSEWEFARSSAEFDMLHQFVRICLHDADHDHGLSQ